MKKRLPSRKTVRAMRDFAHRYAGYSGCPDTPRAMNTVLPSLGQGEAQWRFDAWNIRGNTYLFAYLKNFPMR